MNTLKITLKQHTPLIHFQHDQEGATLRASEFKPRFDNFLYWQLRNDEDIVSEVLSFCRKKDPKVKLEEIEKATLTIFNRMRKCAWMDEKKKSFYYKMRIRVNEVERIDDIKIRITHSRDKYIADFPFILANMGGKSSKEELMNFSFYKKVEVEFMAQDAQLLNKIDYYLDDFLAITNFGNRQDKGFGAFYRENCRENKSKKIELGDFKRTIYRAVGNNVFLKELKKPCEYSYIYYKSIFSNLETDYKKIKAGIKGSPSLLKQYLEKNYTWEKAAIQSFMKIRKVPEECYYIRILLGLATYMEYPKEHIKVKIDHLPQKNEIEIERFQSPLTIKIFENTAFMIPEYIDDRIFEQQYKFTLEKDTDFSESDSFILHSIPNNFDLNDFLDVMLGKLSWKKIRI